jgi:hypothetical protein
MDKMVLAKLNSSSQSSQYGIAKYDDYKNKDFNKDCEAFILLNWQF